jgi:hypothetical protein
MATERHAQSITALIAKMDNANIQLAETPGPTRVPSSNGAALAEPGLGGADATQPGDSAHAAPEVEVETAETAAAPAPRTTKPAAEPKPVSRIERALRIERAAQAVNLKAKAERQQTAERLQQATARHQEVETRFSRVQQVEKQVADTRAALQKEIDLLKTNPTGFAARHGMTGADVAEWTRRGTDPVQARIELSESRVAQALERIERQGNERINKLLESIEKDRVSEANQNFLEHVSGDERFEALQTIYSPDELLQKAEELAQRNDKLQLGWDGDRLCEELESRARKDSRWVRIQQKFTAKPKTPTTPANPPKPSNAPTRTRSNEPQVDTGEPEAEGAYEAEPAARPRARTQTRPTMTPQQKHRAHVERLSRTTRMIGS